MYSPRRRYSRYYSKKYYRNNLFAPSLKKANDPNYYQMKGRILQQSPRDIKEPPTELITRSKLDKMYQTLQLYKYPIPQPIIPDISNFSTVVSKRFTLYELITTYGGQGRSFVINPEWLSTEVIGNINLPLAPEGYTWHFALTNIIYTRDNMPTLSSNDTNRYLLVWDGPFLVTGDPPMQTYKNLITQSLDMAPTTKREHTIYVVPGPDINQCRCNIITYTQSTVNSSLSTSATIDSNITDNGYYYLVTNDPEYPTFNQKLTLSQTAVGLNDYFKGTHLAFNVLVYLSLGN